MTRLLTVDLGTTATKVGLWTDDGLVASAGAAVAISHPRPGWAEQDPEAWWTSVRDAIAALPVPAEHLDAIALCGARETFVPVTDALEAVGTAIVWSDRRAVVEAEQLCRDAGGADAIRARTGLVPDAGLMVAKTAWMAAHEPERLARARWLLSPRDLVVARLTGVVVTDPTMASKTGYFGLDGQPWAEVAAAAGDRLAPVIASTAVAGRVRAGAAAALGLAAGTPVAVGAGDRACEVLGTGASGSTPMVSWGTTANVSVPAADRPEPVPAGAQLTAGALGGWLIEAGLSASGAALTWLGALTGAGEDQLRAELAATVPGARGVIALPWLDGARAPWWQAGARAAFLGLTAAHDRADLARAMIEGVALDVDRSLAAIAPGATRLQLAGGGSAGALWRQVLAAVTARPVARRALADAAGAGACLLASIAVGAGLELERINPMRDTEDPDPALALEYQRLRVTADRVATTVAGLDLGPGRA